MTPEELVIEHLMLGGSAWTTTDRAVSVLAEALLAVPPAEATYFHGDVLMDAHRDAEAILSASPALAFDLQGHRGARGLAPENTLAAFATALSIGVTTLEFDAGLTKDGAVVIAHDRTLNPDIAAPLTFAAYRSNRDPAMDAVQSREMRREPRPAPP